MWLGSQAKANGLVDDLVWPVTEVTRTIGAVAKAIEEINCFSHRATAVRPSLILAVDTPSGLPSDGQAAEGPVLYELTEYGAERIGALMEESYARAIARRREMGDRRQR